MLLVGFVLAEVCGTPLVEHRFDCSPDLFRPCQALVQRQRLAALKRDVGALQIALGEHRQHIIMLQRSVDHSAKETAELRQAAAKHEETIQRNAELCQNQTAQEELLREHRRRVAQLTATVFDLRKETATLSSSLRLEAEATAKFRKEAAEKTATCRCLTFLVP